MASRGFGVSHSRSRPSPVEVPDSVATEVDEGQTEANSLLAAEASRPYQVGTVRQF